METSKLRSEELQIEKEVKDLEQKLYETYGEEVPQETPKSLLKFDIYSDNFSEEEKRLSIEIESLTINAMHLIGDMTEELSRITKAQHNAKAYEETLIGDIESDYEELYKYYADGLETFKKVSKDLQKLSEKVQYITCRRYLKGLTYQEIKKEVQEISDSFGVLDESAFNQSDDDFIKKLSQIFEDFQAVQLISRYQNDNYTLSLNAVVPTNYKDLTEEGLKKFISETLEPCYSAHLEAISALNLPAGEVKKYINESAERIYNALNIGLENVEEIEGGLSVMRRGIVNIIYPQTAITRTMREPFIYGENKPVYEGYYINNKPVNSYMLINSLQDLEGVEGRKLSFEETGICIAVANELLNGNEYVTTQMLYKTWAGGDSTTKLNAKQKEKKNQLIETLRKEEQIIDQREYKKEKNLKEDAIQEPILDIVKAYGVYINGQYQDWCWKIRSIPPFFRHAINLGHIETVPSSHLNIGLNKKYYPLRDYLLEEIHRIRGDVKNTETPTQKRERLKTEAKKRAEYEAKGKTYKSKAERKTQHPTVLFDTIFKKVYDGTKDKRSHEGIKYATEQILSFWKGHGVISDFEMIYDGIGRKKKELNDSTIDYCYGVKISVRNSEAIEEG